MEIARALIATLVMLAVVSVVCDSALASGWSIQATPILAGQPQDALNAISCTSSTGCTAVGDYVNRTGTTVTLVERWNGSGWSSQPTPSLSGNPVLNGVSCETASDCTAVGDYLNSSGAEVALAEHWNGTTWTIQVTPNPSGATSSALSGVSCTPDGGCMAVGSYVNSSGASQSLAESWNGSIWSIAGSPTGGGLSRVSCTAATACTTVNGGTLVERWDGTAWSTQAFAVPTGTTSMQLYGVTCSGASTCVAVGHWLSIHCNNGQPSCNCFRIPYCTIRQSTMVERWDGSAWTIGSNPGAVGFFYDVSCPATNDCTAVGRAAGNQELAARWNGTGWTVQSTPTLSAGGSLSSVSCTAASACIAVGQTGGVSLAERWDGTGWAIQRTINPAGPANPGLSGVSCTTTTACTAVGSYTNTSGSQVGLAEYWTGTSWSTQPTAVPNGSVGNFLSGVACSSPTACTGAGADGTGFGNPVPDVALAEAWNGTGWTDEQALTPSGDQSILTGVSCPAPATCEAVGYAYPLGAGSQALLAERWNGAEWTIEPTPIPSGASTPSFSGVSCATPTACVGVGTTDGALLAEQWSGSAWSLGSPSGAGGLSGVSCTGANACVAVGSSIGAALAEGWNGSSWTSESLATPPGATGSSLSSVSCAAAGDCVAVGYYTNSSGQTVTLAEKWNGTAWTVEATRNPAGAGASYLSGVSCTTATACTAVGHYQNSAGVALALVERYSG